MQKYNNYDAIVKSNTEFLDNKNLRFRKVISKKEIRTGNKRLVGMLTMANYGMKNK